MKLANSTVVAIVVAGGFTLTAYVMGQGHGPGVPSGPASGMNPTGQNMQVPATGNTNPQSQAAPSTTIGPTTSTTIGPTTSTTIGPTTSTTVGPTTSTTVGPITGPAKSTSAAKSKSKQSSTRANAGASPTANPKMTSPPPTQSP